MKTYDKLTGELVEVRYATNACAIEPHREVVRGERIVDDTLFEPVQKVIERCERAGTVRELVSGAVKANYAIPPGVEIDISSFPDLEFGTGDFSDLQRQKDALAAVVPAPVVDPIPAQSVKPTEVSDDASEDEQS
jgi:hypothetical protein